MRMLRPQGTVRPRNPAADRYLQQNNYIEQTVEAGLYQRFQAPSGATATDGSGLRLPASPHANVLFSRRSALYADSEIITFAAPTVFRWPD